MMASALGWPGSSSWQAAPGALAFLVDTVLALAVTFGRPRLAAASRWLIAAALVAGAASGLALAGGEPVIARPLALAETTLWAGLAALLGGSLGDPARLLAIILALALGGLIAVLAPSDAWLMGTGAVAIIGLFLVAGLAADQRRAAVRGLRLALATLGLGFALDILIAGSALGDTAAVAWLEPARPLARAALAVLVVWQLARSGGTSRVAGQPPPARRYDYRLVWPAFVTTLAGDDRLPGDDLPERIVRATAETVGVTGGAVWLAERDDYFRCMASRGLAGCASGTAPALAAVLARSTVPLGDAGALARAGQWPGFLPRPEAVWAGLPLVHKGGLLGLLLLAPPAPRRPLDGEDEALLALLARQAASYLAEDETARQLADMRQYESFTRRFAYVMHDVKNVAGQLSLTLSNARRHRGNPVFYDDMVETLEISVERMNNLLDQLRHERNPRLDRVALDALLRQVAGRRDDRRLSVAEPLAALTARAEPEALESALEHLIDNALEAVGPHGRVRLGLERQGRMAALVIADDGPGLPPELVDKAGRRRAFASRKPGGLGLGLDQARHTVERVGGRFDLDSKPGAGTTIALCLPELEGRVP